MNNLFGRSRVVKRDDWYFIPQLSFYKPKLT